VASANDRENVTTAATLPRPPGYLFILSGVDPFEFVLSSPTRPCQSGARRTAEHFPDLFIATIREAA
jgi:hypothetical protein